jgi:hypothetical protein
VVSAIRFFLLTVFLYPQKWAATIALMILTPSVAKVYVDQHTKLQNGVAAVRQ